MSEHYTPPNGEDATYALLKIPAAILMLDTTIEQVGNHDDIILGLSILEFPNEILANIFRVTPFLSRIKLARTCKRLARLAIAGKHLLIQPFDIRNMAHNTKNWLTSDLAFLDRYLCYEPVCDKCRPKDNFYAKHTTKYCPTPNRKPLQTYKIEIERDLLLYGFSYNTAIQIVLSYRSVTLKFEHVMQIVRAKMRENRRKKEAEQTSQQLE